MSESISERLRHLLDEKAWSQQTLCKRAGVHHQQIYKVVSGETGDPRASTIKRLAKALDVSADYLLDLIDEPQPENWREARKLKEIKTKPAPNPNAKVAAPKRTRTPARAAKG